MNFSFFWCLINRETRSPLPQGRGANSARLQLFDKLLRARGSVAVDQYNVINTSPADIDYFYNNNNSM